MVMQPGRGFQYQSHPELQTFFPIYPIRYTCFSMKITRARRILALFVAGAGLIVAGSASLIKIAASSGTAAVPEVAPAEVSYPAPALQLTDIQGQSVSLDGYRGQVVLVNLWATWCPPCAQEMPTLQAYYDDHATHGFTVIAINDGEPADLVKAFVADYRLTFPVWLDPEYEATEQAFRTLNLPSSFVIDRGGAIRLRWVGAISLKNLERYVTPIILE